MHVFKAQSENLSTGDSGSLPTQLISVQALFAGTVKGISNWMLSSTAPYKRDTR